MDLHELNVRINLAGISTSAMHEAAVALDQSDPRVVALIRSIERHGDQDLKSIQGWSNDAAKQADVPVVPKTDASPPGMVVVDVSDIGSGIGTGPIPIAAMSLANMQYANAHGLNARWAQIVTGTLAEWNAKIGAIQGNLANAGEDPIVRDPASGAVLADLRTFG